MLARTAACRDGRSPARDSHDRRRRLASEPRLPRETRSDFNALDRSMESRLPRLPQPITTAWAACRGHVLVTTPPNPWARYELPEEVFLTPERWLA